MPPRTRSNPNEDGTALEGLLINPHVYPALTPKRNPPRKSKDELLQSDRWATATGKKRRKRVAEHTEIDEEDAEQPQPKRKGPIAIRKKTRKRAAEPTESDEEAAEQPQPKQKLVLTTATGKKHGKRAAERTESDADAAEQPLPKRKRGPTIDQESRPRTAKTFNATAATITAPTKSAKTTGKSTATTAKAVTMEDAAANPSTTKNAAATSATAKSAASKTGTAKDATSKDTAKTATAKSTTAKSAVAKTGITKAVTMEDAAANSTTTKDATAKAATATNTAMKTAAAKTGTAKAATAKDTTAKAAAAKAATAKAAAATKTANKVVAGVTGAANKTAKTDAVATKASRASSSSTATAKMGKAAKTDTAMKTIKKTSHPVEEEEAAAVARKTHEMKEWARAHWMKVGGHTVVHDTVEDSPMLPTVSEILKNHQPSEKGRKTKTSKPPAEPSMVSKVMKLRESYGSPDTPLAHRSQPLESRAASPDSLDANSDGEVVRARSPDLRHDPFEDDPETDGLDPRVLALDNDADLEGIEDDPKRAKDIFDELNIDVVVFDDDAHDGYSEGQDEGRVAADEDAANIDDMYGFADPAAVEEDFAASDEEPAANEEEPVGIEEPIADHKENVAAAKEDVAAIEDDVAAAEDDVAAAEENITAAEEDDVPATEENIAAAEENTAATKEDIAAAAEDPAAAEEDFATGDGGPAADEELADVGEDADAADGPVEAEYQAISESDSESGSDTSASDSSDGSEGRSDDEFERSSEDDSEDEEDEEQHDAHRKARRGVRRGAAGARRGEASARRRRATGARRKGSKAHDKRAQARLNEEPGLEIPIIENAEEGPLPNLPPRRRRGPAIPAPTVGPTELVWSRASNILLKQLHHNLQDVVHWAFHWVEGYLLGYHSYPDWQANMKIEFLASCLRFAAEQTKAPDALVQALQTDVDFTTKLSALLDVRLSQFRSALKMVVDGKVEMLYRLRPKDKKRKRRVRALLKKMRYIYSGDPLKGPADPSKPYAHPMFFSVVRTFLFEKRAYLLRIHPGLFEEVFEGRTFRVIPPAFIALVATAIAAALRDRRSETVNEFTARANKRTYKRHFLALKDLMVQSPRAAIALGQRLYKLASHGMHVPDEDGSDSEAPVQFMDIDAMDTQLTDNE